MSDETKKKRIPKYDRVTLYDEAMKRVDGWIKQAQDSKAGVSLFRKDILNWYILNAPEQLDAKSIESLAAQFFDQERFLKQALKRVRDAKGRGETVSLQELMTDEQSVKPKKPRKPRSSKLNSTEGVLDDSVTASTSDFS
ncbi:MAG TPA: hypothetical protein PLZ57_15405 [Pseudobdellovibrionaceae bacterium]|nr:hypothetical protein [Pseudobdellovibrionaceae bacterium]